MIEIDTKQIEKEVSKVEVASSKEEKEEDKEVSKFPPIEKRREDADILCLDRYLYELFENNGQFAILSAVAHAYVGDVELGNFPDLEKLDHFENRCGQIASVEKP